MVTTRSSKKTRPDTSTKAHKTNTIPTGRARELEEAVRLLRKFRKLPKNEQERQADRLVAEQRHLDNTVYERRIRQNNKTGEFPISGSRKYLQEGRGILFPVGKKHNGSLIWKTEDVDFLAEWLSKSQTNPWTREPLGQPTLPRHVYKAVMKKANRDLPHPIPVRAGSEVGVSLIAYPRPEFERDIQQIVHLYSNPIRIGDVISDSDPSWRVLEDDDDGWQVVKYYRLHPSSSYFSNTSNIFSTVFLTCNFEDEEVHLQIFTGDVTPVTSIENYEKYNPRAYLVPPRQWVDKYTFHFTNQPVDRRQWTLDRGNILLAYSSRGRYRLLQDQEKLARKIVTRAYNPKGRPKRLEVDDALTNLRS